MPRHFHTHKLTSNVSTTEKFKLQHIATQSGVSLHALTSAVLRDYLQHGIPTDRLKFRGHQRLEDGFIRPTEVLIVEMRQPLAERLHRTARQLVDTTGKCAKPSVLAGMILLDYAGHAGQHTGIRQEIADNCRRDFEDGFPFMGHITKRVAYKRLHPCHIRYTFAEMQSVRAKASMDDEAMAVMARRVLDTTLPLYVDLEDEKQL